MSQRTVLYEAHVASGARMVDFAGWDMPVHYGSQIDEHHAVRRDAGMFDVSHMCVVDLHGERARPMLARLLANDVAKLTEPGKALYSCMLNERGGVIDDLICYFLREDFFRLVVNAGTREKDLEWIGRYATEAGVRVEARDDLAMIAVQGPQARARAAGLLGEKAKVAEALRPFTAARCDELFVARTGYTGEDGWELLVPVALAEAAWAKLLELGLHPCGLGARDTLRLEAGMNLYGQDMDEETTPLESALGWTVAFDPPERKFNGRAALEAQKAAGVRRKLVGLVLEGRGVLRPEQKVVVAGHPDGAVTSGTFSPTMERSIALARVPKETGARCEVEIRGRRIPATVVRPPFVRNGEVQVKL